MGTLRIQGTIDLNQFWPTGSSDADTTKMKITLAANKNSFAYRATGHKKFISTNVFNDAVSIGQGGVKPVINTNKKDGLKNIIVRLQGVDAPELHYKAAPLKTSKAVTVTERKKFNELNKERRQPFAESSTVALAKHLKQYANTKGIATATFESEVDYPYEVIDTYGRFIGDVNVGGNDINVWLVENGWGMPAFYTSMSAKEINIFLNAWKNGKLKAGRIGTNIIKNASPFDWGMLYEPPGLTGNGFIFNIGDDKGKVLMPKIFRRQVSWMVQKKAGVIPGSTNFNTYLKKAPDQLVLLNDFLTNGIHAAKRLYLHDLISSGNQFLKNGEELVFQEKPGTLENAKGKKLTDW
jgi:endonuclease YncB( thermonuclease family)